MSLLAIDWRVLPCHRRHEHFRYFAQPQWSQSTATLSDLLRHMLTVGCHSRSGHFIPFSFVNMGFPKADVVDVMRRLNYRGANAAKVGEDAVVEALLGSK